MTSPPGVGLSAVAAKKEKLSATAVKTLVNCITRE